MSHASRNNIGAYVATRQGLPNLSQAAGSRNGAAIDRLGFASLVLIDAVGAATGAPSTQTHDLKIQESDDGSSGWTDVSGAALAQKTTATAEVRRLDFNLAGVKRFIRTVETNAFTGGTTPAFPSAAVVVLGGSDELPAV